MIRKFALILVLLASFMGCGGTDVGGTAATTPPDGTGVPDLVALGRQRILSEDGAATVASIDALTAEQSNVIYTNVGLFNDGNPSLTGSQLEAVRAVGAISSSLFGAGAVFELMAPLGDNGQSVIVSFARNLDPVVEQGLSRCQDALTAVGAVQLQTGRNPEVESLLSPELATMPKFHALRLLLPGTLPDAQRQVLKNLRDNLTYPPNGTLLQKVIEPGDVDNYLNGTFDPKVFGFQAVYSDVANLTTASELIEGLRLDYPGGFAGQTLVGAVTYFQDDTFHMGIPYRAANGGNRTDAYPFAGNGFTATVRANAIPEWILSSAGANLQDGSQLSLIDDAGNRTVVATLQGGVWVLAGQPRGEAPPARQRVEKAARYQGADVWVISQDAGFYYVNAGEDLGLLDQRQVGRGEFRGKIAKSDTGLVF